MVNNNGSRRPLMESTPPPYPLADRDRDRARAREKHRSLLRDFQDLRRETDTKKLELLKANQKKNKLLAEVKFLRRKLKSFSEIPSLKAPHRPEYQFQEVKQLGSGKQSGKAVMPSARHVRVRGKNSVLPSTSHLEERNYSSAEAPVPGNNALLDLNKDAEELEGWQSPRLNMRSMDNGVMTNDLKLPLCRDVGNEASQVGRRKISWQDQLPLRV